MNVRLHDAVGAELRDLGRVVAELSQELVGCARRAAALDFAFGESVGETSRWNTLRALRVLRWYRA